MEIEIINIYNNEVLPHSQLKGAHGVSFLFRTNTERILMDVGGNGNIFSHNMKMLNIDPNSITHLIFSHGHYDHTKALPHFLNTRTNAMILPVFAHPLLQEKKRIKIGFIQKDIGFPTLNQNQKEKIQFNYDTKSQSITNYLYTTGEISHRLYKDGTEKRAEHIENNKFVADPVKDDNSLILKTTEGIVIITGCAHAGILNIIHHTKQMFSDRIIAVIGGTHMVRYTEDEVIHTANVMKNEFDYPDLYLNHCTDKLPLKLLKTSPVLSILRDVYGKSKIKKCHAGTILKYQV